MILPQDVTIQEISTILNDAAIDHRIEADGEIYVTGLAFNFWINLDRGSSLLNLGTYWDFLPGVSELEALRCANACNASLVALQFYILGDGEGGRSLRASQIIPFGDGLVRIALLRAFRVFADVFKAAISDTSRSELFLPLVGSPDYEPDSDFISRGRILN